MTVYSWCLFMGLTTAVHSLYIRVLVHSLCTSSEMHFVHMSAQAFVHYCAFLSLCTNVRNTMLLTSKCAQVVLKSCTNVAKQETLVHSKRKCSAI